MLMRRRGCCRPLAALGAAEAAVPAVSAVQEEAAAPEGARGRMSQMQAHGWCAAAEAVSYSLRAKAA